MILIDVEATKTKIVLKPIQSVKNTSLNHFTFMKILKFFKRPSKRKKIVSGLSMKLLVEPSNHPS